jgi:type IV pilus assembly protein PilQ
MIRYLFTFLIAVQLGMGLMSCTSVPDEETTSETNEPISDSDLSTSTAGETDTGDDTITEPKTEGDDLDADLDTADSGETAAQEPAGSEKDLEDDLDADLQDSKPEEKKAEEPLPVDDLQAAEPTPEPIPEPVAPTPPPEPVVEKAKIRDIRFVSNSSGGTVVIDSDKPVTYQTRLNAGTGQFIIEIADAELPPALQRPYSTRGAGSRIGGINAYQSSGSTTARVIVQLLGSGSTEPIVQQEGTSLVVIPPAAPLVAKTEPPPSPMADGESTPRAARSTPLGARTLDEFLTGTQKFFGRNISLQVKDADVRDVVNFLAEESGANIVMSDDVEGKISLKLRRVPWDQALVMVMRTKALGYVRQGNVLRISTLKALQAETEATAKILEAQKNIVPALVEVISVSYANLEDLVKNLTPFLSKDGKVVADSRTSTIIVTDRGEVVERVRKLVKTLDIPPAQVSIESKIVEASENFQNFVGVNWSMGGSPVTISNGGGANGTPIDLTLNGGSQAFSKAFATSNPLNLNLTVGALDLFGDLGAALTLAERDSLAKVISAPRISAMNREKSTITQEGENVSIKQSRVNDPVAGPQVSKEEKRTPFKLELSVTPQITADGGVIMDLDVKREFLGPVEDEEIKARAINKRSAKTKVLVRNGQTAVIGGIYTSDELEAQNGVPGLKNIPILGWLFKQRTFERNKNELLIFLTPRILAQDDMSQQPGAVTN